MSGRNGHYRTALGLGLVSAIAMVAIWIVAAMVPLESLRPTPGEDSSSYDIHYQTRRGACDPTTLHALSSDAASEEKRAECSRQDEDHRIGQQSVHQAARLAEAAEEGLQLGREQTRTGFLQAILSTLAVVFTAWAAWAAARAASAAADGVEASQRSAKAAEDAVAKSDAILAHAQNVSQIELRAYVFTKNVHFTCVTDPEGKTLERVDVKVSMQNFGPTPARNVTTSSANARLKDGQSPVDIDYPEERHPSPAIGPGGEVWMEFSIPGEYFYTISPMVSVYLWASVEYDDMFGIERHRTEMCQRLVVKGVIGPPGTFGIGPEVTPSFNGSDQDCYRQPQPCHPEGA